MIRRTTASPIPAPWERVVKNTSKIRSFESGAIPGPAS
jgi:hypothetical protein